MNPKSAICILCLALVGCGIKGPPLPPIKDKGLGSQETSGAELVTTTPTNKASAATTTPAVSTKKKSKK